MRAPSYAVLALIAAIGVTPAQAQLPGALGGAGAREAGRHLFGPDAGRLFAGSTPSSIIDVAPEYFGMSSPVSGGPSFSSFGVGARYLGNSEMQPLFSVTAADASVASVTHNMLQLGVSLTTPTFDHNKMSVTGGANYRHVSNSTNSGAFFEELDYTAWKNATTKLTIAEVVMWEHDQGFRTAAANAGLVPGLLAAVAQQNWELDGEYDFKTNYSGENGYLFTGLYAFGSSKLHPSLFASIGKHSAITAGLRLRLK